VFGDFDLEFIDVGDARLRVRHGGSGPPVLLLHGHPRTHATWHRVAPLLADRFTVVCPDLRGFGQSSKPSDLPDHSQASKRAKARDCVALMDRLGHGRFAVVGHDRGALTAFRCAMDHADRVAKLAILDAVPVIDHLDRCDARFAKAYWHWFFFAQCDKPERAILADPLWWYGGSPQSMGAEAWADYVEAITDPEVVRGMLGDYRAGLSIDVLHESADRAAGRRLSCPTLVLWSLRDDLEDLHGDPREVWRGWADDVSGRGIESGHHMAEDAPEALAMELTGFLTAR
jgi:haloacetate dehalogenase